MAADHPAHRVSYIHYSSVNLERFLHILHRLVHVVTMAIIIVVVGCMFLYFAAYAIIRTHFEGTAELPADCGIVFGAAVSGYNTPGPAIVRRVGAAANLYREGKVRRLILSGGMGKGRGVSDSEANVMRTQAIELGVDSDDISIEPASHSTWENILYSRPLTEGCSSVVGISDQFHLARIEFLSWRQDWAELQTVPAEERPPVALEQRSIVREVFAMIYYMLYIDRVFPGIQRSI